MTQSNENNTSNRTLGDFPRKSNTDLITIAFKNANAFKRHRALAEMARQDGEKEKAIFHDLKQYKHFDALELNLRAIQKGLWAVEDLNEE